MHAEAISHDRNFAGEATDQFFTVAIVDVNDRAGLLFFRLRSEIMEQFGLGLEIIFHRAMKIEVVLGQIGEDGDVPFDSAGSFLGQRVRRDFHRGGAATGVDDLREQFLNVERFGRGSDRRQNTIADFVLHGAEQSTAHPGLFANVFDEKCRRRFPIGAGDRGHF